MPEHDRPKSWLWRALNFLRVPNDNPALTLAQFEAFSKQVPLLYFILFVNTVSVAWTHRNVASDTLVLYIPGALCSIFLIRGLGWLRKRHRQVTPAEAYAGLTATNRLAAPIAIVCVGWSLALLPTGNAYQQAHVAFYMAITVIGIIFCLMHLRSAAFMVTVLVNVPFFVAMLMTGEETFVATGLNILLVSFALIVVLLTHYRDFRQLGHSRQELQERNAAIQALSDENLRLANLDSLTQIPNRRSFFHNLEKAFSGAAATGERLAVGVIDLDGFKPINDMYGHAAGDKVLVEIGARLGSFESESLKVHRLGGDEFALIIIGDVDETNIMSLGVSICDAIAEPMKISNATVQVTGSLGVAIYPDVGSNGQDLYERADYALYTAKRHQRAGTVIFNHKQAQELSRQKVVEEALLAANLSRELSLAYQPIIDLSTGRCAGFEALARWNSPQIGSVSPAEFIPIAEHAGRIALITRILLDKALAEAKHWPLDVYLSFNLSPHDLATQDGTMRIIAAVGVSGIDPRRINFEITETAVMHDFAQAKASAQMLRHLGTSVSLDDFGTGFSSLSHVHRLPLSKIKIDGSFVRNIHTEEPSRKIVKSVLALCADMGIEAVVEGVETAEELEVLRTLGARWVQGFYFTRPMPALEARELAAAGNAAHHLRQAG
ncbi:EAL domain-containing protein [Ciceribacter sp. L1K23]|uniref:putative bifunctional diguanylate cyclase/phosphodiesterase n=1 Tax=Ciceribacter sp. L1K23 TaxID=2820276 RepID=UPI00201149D9|nr:EAL domain-containing protein [Ciceribacter sp. L1K23]